MRTFYKLTLVDIKGGDISTIPVEARDHYFEEKTAEALVSLYKAATIKPGIEMIWEGREIQSLTHEEAEQTFLELFVNEEEHPKKPSNSNKTAPKKKRK